MNSSKEAIKRLRQETCPATYMADFDKEECLKTIEKDLEVLEIFKNHLQIEVESVCDNLNLVSFKENNEEYDYTTIFVSKEEKELLEEWKKRSNNEN